MAATRNPRDTKVTEFMERTFKESCTYFQEKLLKYFTLVAEIQSKAHSEYKNDFMFSFTRFSNMNAYVKVANILAEKWANPDLKDCYQKCTSMYLENLFRVAKKLDEEKKKNTVANYGRLLAGIAFMNGDYYLALHFLCSVLELVPLDCHAFALVIKWSCKLREFKIFDKYEEAWLKHPNYPKEVDELRNVCRLFRDFFSMTEVAQQIEVIQKAFTLKEQLEKSSKTFFNYFCLQLLYNLLAAGSKLPQADIAKHGDFIHHCIKESDRTAVILTNRYSREFLTPENKVILYKFDSLPDGATFLKSVVSIPEYFDAEHSVATALFEHGCLHDVEVKLLQLLYLGTKLAIPYRVIQPLNFFYYLKLRTTNDQEKLKGLGAMLALLFGKMSDFNKQVTPYSRFRQDLLADTYFFQARDDSESVLNRTTVCHVSSIPEHLPSCPCYVCYELLTNGVFYAERKYSDLLIDVLTIDNCLEYNKIVLSSGYRRIKKRRDELFTTAFGQQSTDVKEQCAILSVASYVCLASANCVLMNKNIGDVSKKQLCNYLINVAAKFPCELRYYWLLGRQMPRKTYSLELYPWLQKWNKNENATPDLNLMFDAMGISKSGSTTPPKSPSREALTQRTNVSNSPGKRCFVGMADSDVDEVHRARTDFKNYQHLFYSEWRHRLCFYLGAYLSEWYPWYAAWYFMESISNSLRQSVRLHKKDPMDLRFRDIDSFKAAIRSLPADFTLVQLIIDTHNVLWLIRCNAVMVPIVVPIAKVDIGRDAISRRMFNILVENDKSVKSCPLDFWKARKVVDDNLHQLICDVESEWLSHFRVLLHPFGTITGTLKTNVCKLEGILSKIGFSKEKSEILSQLFLHASEEDYKYLLFVFSIIERDRFTSLMDEKLQSDIYKQLKCACPFKAAHKTYMEQDKYSVLIVSPKLSSYPWEILPVYEPNPFVLRVQSFHFFHRLLEKAASSLPLPAKSKDSYFLLNPDNNLPRTQKRMEDTIKLDMLNGIIGKPPEKGVASSVFENHNFYLYIGHGSGSKYFGSSSIRQTICKSVAILMGCSSVRIEDEGWAYDGRSAVHDYAVAGSPCTIGCLWMVTDGEIDRFTIAFLDYCFTEWVKNDSDPTKHSKTTKKGGVTYPYRLLIRAVVKAREACRLKTLTGGSVVVYGIPVFNDNSVIEKPQTCDDDVQILN